MRPWNEGYEVFARRSTGSSHPGRCYRARGVVLSGGVLGTVKLLMQCRRTGMLPGLSPQLGNYVRTNSESLIQPGQNRAPAYIPIANEVARRLGEKMNGIPISRVLKNKHQAVSQGVRRFGKRSPPTADEPL